MHTTKYLDQHFFFIQEKNKFCFYLILAGVRSVRPSPDGIHGDVTTQESSDWLEMIWMFVASLVAPDEEEEGIHHLTETLTCKRTFLTVIHHQITRTTNN